jgi:hypothetical protein
VTAKHDLFVDKSTSKAAEASDARRLASHVASRILPGFAADTSPLGAALRHSVGRRAGPSPRVRPQGFAAEQRAPKTLCL